MSQQLDQRQAPAVSRVAPLLAGCLAVGALSLVVVPSTITFDPLTWATWAREIVHLNLNTNGGPAWKPLPVMVDVVFAPLGAAEKWVWLAVARGGATLGIVMCYRLARRLGGRGAGLVAAAGFALSDTLVEYLAPLGMSEPLLAGLALLAIERHLDHRRGQAYALVYLCLLLRPEAFPFFVGYSIYLWRRGDWDRFAVWALGLSALLPVWWILPDWVATGNPLRSSQRAANPTQGGPLLTAHPAWAVVEGAFNTVVLPVVVGAVIAMVVAGFAYLRRRQEGLLFAVSCLCLGWLVVVALETQAHLGSGDLRYSIVAYALACVLAGVGWVRFVQLAGARIGRPPVQLAGARIGRPAVQLAGARIGRPAVPWAVALVVLVASAPFVAQRVDDLTGSIGEVPYQAHKYGELASLIHQVGGAGVVRACGPVTADIYQMPAIAWFLDLHQSQIVIATATQNPPTNGTVFRTRTTRSSPLLPPTLGPGNFRVVVTTAQWQLLSTCDRYPR